MKKRITQQEIAKRVGISQSYVSALLNGRRKPSAALAVRLERATGRHRLFWLYPREYTEEGTRRAAATGGNGAFSPAFP